MALTTFIPPVLELLGISAVLAMATTLVYKYFTDQAVMREMKASEKKLREQMKLCKDQPDKLMEINKQLLSFNGAYMKHTMKPMFITMIPFILVFGWLKAAYECSADAILTGCVNAVMIPIPFWAGHLQWLGTYLVFSMILTSVFRKLLKVV